LAGDNTYVNFRVVQAVFEARQWLNGSHSQDAWLASIISLNEAALQKVPFAALEKEMSRR
jgi:hypothetical protein